MTNTKKEIDVVFVDEVTMKRMKACEHARRTAQTDWAKEYWTNVIKRLLDSCTDNDADRVLH